jgi:hypothetical protein
MLGQPCRHSRGERISAGQGLRDLYLRFLALITQDSAEQPSAIPVSFSYYSGIVVYAPRVGNQRQVTGSHFSMVTDNYWPE